MKHVLSERHAALGITLIAVCLLAGQAMVAADFDGDDRDDLLQRHLHSDAWRYHTLVDDVPEEHILAIESEPVWRFVATGDFDGNGYDDVLVRRYDTLESGYHAVTADGAEFRALRLTVNPLYDVLGAGDFDGDGADEILIRRNEGFGAWLYYDVDGTRVTLRRNFGLTQNFEFEFAAIGDLDGDGRDDVLLRHRTRGHWIAYLMNGTRRAALRRPRITQNLQFALRGFADITGDGKADPILRNVTNGEWIYYAAGNWVGTGQRYTMRLHRGLGMPREDDWQFAAIGDYDGDGRATPMLRDPLTGDWRLYDIEGNSSDEVRFPGLDTALAWAAVDALPQNNPAEFAQVEFLQGPPTFRKDYRTGEEIGPIPGNRPENGAEPRAAQVRPIANRWSEEDRGFVTALWHRWMAVAVAVDHPYSHPLPSLSARVVPVEGDAQDLPSVYDVTDPVDTGYRTELVFELDRDMNVPGAEVEVAVHAGGREHVERLALFGETIEDIFIRWVPISSATVPAVDDLGSEGLTHVLDAYMPIARYRATVSEPVAYEVTGDEAEGEELDDRAVWDQMRLLQTTEGCGRGELYVGLYNGPGLLDAGLAPNGFSAWGGYGVMSVSGGLVPDASEEYLAFYAHEFAHAQGLLHHVSCPDAPVEPYDWYQYPYEEGVLGPARGWHPLARTFYQRGVAVRDGRGAGGEPRDLMSYCTPRFVSDFTYQMVLAYQQAPFYSAHVEQARACLAQQEVTGVAHKTLAVMGEVNDDGTVTVLDMAVSDQPPWAPPTAATLVPGTRLWTIELRDAAGGITHRQAIPVPERAGVGHGDVRRVWSYRIPYPNEAETIIVRDPSGALRGTDSIDCRGCGNVEAR